MRIREETWIIALRNLTELQKLQLKCRKIKIKLGHSTFLKNKSFCDGLLSRMIFMM